jgi:hypothetical protein
LHFHVNASLTTLNLAKAELMIAQQHTPSTPCSIASVKAQYFNQHFLDRIIRIFGLDPTCLKKHPEYHKLRDYGKIAA